MRLKSSRTAVIAFIAIITGITLTLRAFSSRAEFSIDAELFVLPANGVSVATVRATPPSSWLTKPVKWKIVQGKSLVDVIDKTPSALSLQTKLNSGNVTVQAICGSQKKRVTLFLVPDATDSDKDGFPDVAELTSLEDKTAFLKRFTAVARAQYVNPSPRWDEKNRDCAGLVRFAYQEALKRQDEIKSSDAMQLGSFAMSGVNKFNYPDVPYLGTRLFRTKRGVFLESDLKRGAFSAFVDSRNLMEHNTRFVSKDVQASQEGDLLFFLHFDDLSMPYHAMIYTGTDESGKDWLVYHTGPVQNTKGKVKMITMETLLNYDDARWHPVRENPYFLGVYRLKIVD